MLYRGIKQARHEALGARNHVLRDAKCRLRQAQERMCPGNVPHNKVEKGHTKRGGIMRPTQRIKYRALQDYVAARRRRPRRVGVRIRVSRQIEGL